MGARASQARRGPSWVLSVGLIAAGTVFCAAWMALPARHDGGPGSLDEVVASAGRAPAMRALALRQIAARSGPELLEVVQALASGTLAGGEPLDAEGRALLEEALGQIEPRALVGILEKTAPSGDVALRREALRIVAARGGPESVDALLVIASGTEPVHLEESAEDFEQSLAALIARAPEALEYLPGAWREATEPAFEAMVRATGACGRARALIVLADTLGRVPEADGVVLAEIGRLGEGCDPRIAREAALRVEDYLDGQHASFARAAVNALGRLGARESVPALVDLLADEDTGLARTAHSALQRHTGLRFRGDHGPWRAWLASEETWIEERLPKVLSGLQDPDPVFVREALRELETHSLDRHALAEEVAPLLARPEIELRLAACDALRRLGSLMPLEALIEALSDEPPVAEAARAALVALTGLDLPGDPAVWAQALAARR